MAQPKRDEDTLRRYLLRTLPEDERARLELEVLRDDAAFEELQAVEDDLFHDYAGEGLAEGERLEFERTLLASPAGPARLAAARALLERLEPPPLAPVWHRPAWVALAATVILALTLWLLRGPAAVPGRQAQVAPTPSAAAPSPAAPPSSEPPAERLVLLALSPGALRAGGAMPRARLTADVTRLRLALDLPARALGQRLEVSLRTAEGATAWSAHDLRGDVDARVLTLEPPLEALPEADYELLLSASTAHGREPLAEYRFRLLRD